MPKSVSCADIERGKTDIFTTIANGGSRIHVGAFPIVAGAISGHLLVLHDLGFVTRRVREVRFYTALGMVGVAVGLGLLAAAVTMTLLRHWSWSVRAAIADVRRGTIPAQNLDRRTAIGSEIHALLSEFRAERRYVDGIHVEWSPKTLHRLLEEELPGVEVLVVSNREPYIHNKSDDGITLQTPASGLVAALEPVMRACGGTWIAHGSGSADRDTVDADDRIAVPPASPAYTLRRVWLTAEEQNGYYYGLANEGLWPLCHVAFVRPAFRESDWAQYQAVNERFADAVVQEATRDDPIVLVQDYHFALLPRMIRERLPKATIITFWHIPWPNSETFSIFPWRAEILDGLLGSTILGFHTRFHCNNFVDAVDRFMESRIDRETASITFGGHETMIRAYPISIEWPPAALADQLPVEACRDAVRRALLAAAGHPHRRRHRTVRLHQGHHRPHPRHRRPAHPPSGMAGKVRLHPGGGADAQRAGGLQRPAGGSACGWPTRSTRRHAHGRLRADPARRAPSRAAARSSSCSAPPTSASSRACTTA